MRTRIYIVSETGLESGEKTRLVESSSAGRAMRHVAKTLFSIKPASAKQVAEHVGKGVKVEQVEQ